ncbi:MAG: DUF4097 family beta strand repeat-containing protein [Candidatus Limnocylindria bacterium]
MPSYRRVQDIEHEIGAAGSLALAVTSADVRLTATAGETVRVRATFEIGAGSDQEADEMFETLRLRVESGNGTLSVHELDGHHGFGGTISRLLGGRSAELDNVEVEAPAGCRLQVRVVSGDVQASGFRGSQRFQSVSGDLRLTEAGGELDIDSVSGDVSLRAVEPVSLKMNNVSGDLSAQAPAFDGLRLQSVSGDVSVDGELTDTAPHAVDTVSGDLRLASASGMTIAVRGMSSDVHSALPHRLEGTADRRRLIVGDGAASVAFNSMSGDLAVTRSRQQPHPAAAVSEPAAPPGSTDRMNQNAVLGALERGEIDVDEAMRRLGNDG